MPRFVTRRPNNHHHSTSQKSDCLETHLAVIPPRVLDDIVGPAKTIDASMKSKPLSPRAD
jgi:hypothetical protein